MEAAFIAAHHESHAKENCTHGDAKEKDKDYRLHGMPFFLMFPYSRWHDVPPHPSDFAKNTIGPIPRSVSVRFLVDLIFGQIGQNKAFPRPHYG
jgi:hypothetical protein